jgi:adenylate cyclase
MADKGSAKSFLETKWFGLLIGLAVFVVIAILTYGTPLISNLETKVLDFNFRMKNPKLSEHVQEGVTVEEVNPRISSDILIVAIDDRSLARFGRWPFPRYRHADLVNTFTRIADQTGRERALLLDLFFSEPDEKSPQDDAVLVEAIRENGRVFLETVLQSQAFDDAEREASFARQQALADRLGKITKVSGRPPTLFRIGLGKVSSFFRGFLTVPRSWFHLKPLAPPDPRPTWLEVESFRGVQPPLAPYAQAVKGYGHANFSEDDDSVYRRASLVVRASQFLEEIPIDQLSEDTPVDTSAYERLSWNDVKGSEHHVPLPLDDGWVEDLRARIKNNAVPYNEGFPFSDLSVELAKEFGASDELFWLDSNDKQREISVPLTPGVLEALRKEIERDAATLLEKAAKKAAEAGEEASDVTVEDLVANKQIQRIVWKVRKYREIWVPAVTLALTAEYLNVKISDVEVVLGKHIRIPSPQHYDTETKSWRPYAADFLIPIDERGQMLVNFMGPPSSAVAGAYRTYPVHSYSRHAASPPGSDPATWDDTRGMENKIVLVGAFSQGMAEDQKTTPYGLMFGVEIHANALNTILMGNFLRYAPLWLSLLILFGIVMLTAFMSGRLSTVLSLLVLLGMVAVYFVLVLIVFDFSAYILTLSAPLIGAFLCSLAVIAYRTVFEERDKRRNKAMFGKMVGPEVLKEILEHGVEPGGRDRHMTVFFSDIRGFSSISERMSAQELLIYLNRYLSYMADTVKDYNGTIDKYIGDAVMGYWGAPIDQPEHALLACKCALKSMEVLKQFNEEWLMEHPEDHPADIGIGISTGIMTAGLMGSRDHLNYTLIGDAVNLGSRLEGANKEYYSASQGAGHYSRILISENTYLEVKDKVIARDLDVVRVKGRQQPTVIYELIDVVGGYEPPKPPKAKGKMLAEEAAADRRERAGKTRAKGR